jgi:hypothetical protein
MYGPRSNKYRLLEQGIDITGFGAAQEEEKKQSDVQQHRQQRDPSEEARSQRSKLSL